jgi:capsular exopolysaccharide synthesis family protein
VEQPNGPVAEAYRTLRTRILFAASQSEVKVVMVCSAVAGEGKTTTASNLAVSLASARKRVILLSADLRKPRIHRFFGMSNDIGLSTVLSGDSEPWALLGDQGIANLRVMVSGPVPTRPGELLQSERMAQLIDELREVADFVIIDTAPVLLVADAVSMAPLTDAVILVADAERTTRGSLSSSRDAMDQVNAPILGAVINNFDPSRARAFSVGREYGYGYYYRYGGSRYGYGQGYYREEGSNGEAGRSRRRGGTPVETGPDAFDQR